MNDQRVKFNQGQQKLFIIYVIQKQNLRYLKDLLSHIQISYSSLKSYYREDLLIPYNLFIKLCKLSGVNPKSLDISFLPKNWGESKGGKKGIISMKKKYSRLLKEWCSKGGKNSGLTNLKEIKYPKLGEELAEFIGAYLGDGTITRYFIRFSGDYRYDMPYFKHLSKLILRLFEIRPVISRDKRMGINTAYLILLSKKVCSFLNKNYIISYGNKIKNKTGIPTEILNNQKLAIACLRGLIDTDGSVSRRGRNGSQFCVQFTNHNRKLLQQAYNLGKNLGIFTYLTGNETGTNKWENIIKYFKIVGSSNLKHIVRFRERYLKGEPLYRNEVSLYYKKALYRNLPLPFRMGL